MLIGISGKISSGKDTVGKIIQYLIDSETRLKADKISFDKYIINKDIFEKNLEKQFNRIPSDLSDVNFAYTNGWQIKKFADKLKDIVCLLIGCTREQLEDREFKEKELGEEWKGTKLRNPYSNNTIIIPQVTHEEIDLMLGTKYLGYVSDGNIKLTPRLLLQLLGTDCGRNIIHPNIWVNALMSNYFCKDCGWEENHKGTMDACSGVHKLPNWIITDMRFPNEMQAVKSRGGITIRVIRPVTLDTIESFHESETALDDEEFKHTIFNEGSIEDLIDNVKNILIEEKII